jgi:diphthamide biosynthesis protein 2
MRIAGKKSYTMLMGRPNPAKLANFPECDVFVLVACAQTVLLDSKEYLAPLITPFEAELAFVEGKEWTGAFNLELGQLPKPREELLQNGDDARTPLTGVLLVTFCVRHFEEIKLCCRLAAYTESRS